MAIDPTSHSIRPNKKAWRHKLSTFDMYVNVPDYPKFCQATETEARQIVANLFLASLDTYLSKRKDIDTKRLADDVEKVFREEGVL